MTFEERTTHIFGGGRSGGKCYQTSRLQRLANWAEQQRSGMKHLLENYIDPKSTPGQELTLSLERLEKILGEKKCN